jgi:outer membrane autotransporter protein
MKGGNGGDGGGSTGNSHSGGGGGAGGYGVVLTGTGHEINSNIILGGDGGDGGNSSTVNGRGADGGDGGIGLKFTSSGTLTNNGTIQGGDGGTGGLGSSLFGTSKNGSGGDAIVGMNISITNNGNIIGGTGGNAITFTGGNNNSLTMTTGSSITGNIAINSGSALTFDQTDDYSLDNIITGNGRLIKNGSGTLTLTGNHTYSGGTTISAGTLQIGDGGTSGSIAGDMTNNAALVFNRSDDTSFAGTISGSGTFTKAGAGTLNLTGDNSAFTGTSTVESGLLKVNGSLGGTILVENGGTLGGSGTIGALTVNSTVAPGNSIGTLNVGNITFNPGSIYEVEINAAGQSDKIIASGTATINGGSVKVLAEDGDYAPSTTYTILEAGTLTGTFDGVTSNLAFLDPSLSYDLNNVYLTMARNAVAFTNVGITRNQIATGGGVESLGAGHAVYDSVVGLSAVQARNAFDQLSGELHASVQGALIEESHWVRDSANDRLRATGDSIGHGSNFWIRGMGNWGKNNGNSNAASIDRDTRGLMAGFDTQFGERGQGGLLIGKTNTDLNAGRGRGKADVDSIHLGLYGALSLNEGLNLRAGAFYSKHDIDSRRTLSFAGFNNRLTDDRTAQSVQTFAELAYRASLGNATLEPFANLANVQLHSDSSSESGGAAALRSSSRNTSTSFLTLGVRPSLDLDMGKTKAKLYGSLGWQHAFSDTTPKSRQRFVGAGDTFTVAGTPIAKDAAAIEAGMRMELGANSSLNLSYKGQFSNKTKDQGAQATLEWRF